MLRCLCIEFDILQEMMMEACPSLDFAGCNSKQQAMDREEWCSGNGRRRVVVRFPSYDYDLIDIELT